MKSSHLVIHCLVASLLLGGGCRNRSEEVTVPPAVSSTIADVRDRIELGQNEEALRIAKQMLVASPDDPELMRLVAFIDSMEGRYLQAGEAAVSIARQDGNTDPISDLLQAFDWHLRGGDYAAAENDLRLALQMSADDPRPNRTIAQLLNSQGRRHEASSHVLKLARLGEASPRELLSLVDRGGPFQLVDFAQVIDVESDTTSLFAFGKARHQLVAENDPRGALTTLDQIDNEWAKLPSVQAFRALLLSEITDTSSSELDTWLQDISGEAQQYPEFWRALGRSLQSRDRLSEAARAFSEALRRDPTDRQSLRALAATLSQLGETDKATTAQTTLATLDQVFRIASSATPEQSLWIGEQLQQLGRHWEALGWFRYAMEQQGQLSGGAAELNRRAEMIRQWQSDASQEQIVRAMLDPLLGFDVATFPLPDLEALDPGSLPSPPRTPDQPPLQQVQNIRFRDVAKQVGIDTRFFSEYPIDEVDFYLHQANGGGLAVLDFDLDGRLDLYVAQSGGHPNVLHSSEPNELYRQFEATEILGEFRYGEEPAEILGEFRYGDVSQLSGSDDRKYAQGVCAADVNQDGFTDLLLANIGPNVLLINQGDGTFRDRSEWLVDATPQWTSSIAVGDLDGDQLPEIVEVNYVDDPLVFQRKCVGKRLDCTPQRFTAAVDRIFRSVGDGSFVAWEGAIDLDQKPNYGFGVVLGNFDDAHGNDLFISNDGDLNHFWRSAPSSDNKEGQTFQLVEGAGVSGCSVGMSGIAQACMGIASGDFDRNGKLDLAITNFYNEPVNLFLQNNSGFFQDDARKMGLADATNGVLGFGTQAADFNNDGWLDLAMLNGHIYDARYADIPFRMPPQVFSGGPSGFVQAEVEGSEYFTQPQLGRTLALWDWNRDGRMDMVANHLDLPLALLENQSPGENWIQLSLVGVESERSAVGTKVIVRAGDQQWTAWNLGGDGYMSTNTPILHVGLGGVETIDEVEIKWPSGRVETFDSIQINEQYLVIEGANKLEPQD